MLLLKPTSTQLENNPPPKVMGKLLVWSLFVLMFFLHQDFWWWDKSFLVFGFLPIGLAYHAGFSLACSVLGWFAIQHAWPEELEKFADSDDKSSHQ